MSTIPTIFNEAPPPYTAVGGTVRAASSGLTAVLLNRGGRYLRRSVFQDFEKAGFDYVVSVEGPRESYDVEELSLRYPFVKFLLLKDQVTVGEQINLAASETSTPLFLVLWNDVRFIRSGGAERIAERLLSDPGADGGGRLCTVPLVQNGRFEPLPTLVSPAFFRGSVKTIPFAGAREGLPSLYPFDAVGIYGRDRFIRLGGFDGTIASAHWQLMDFGFRAQLWGESIRSTQLVKVMYEGELPPEDATVDSGYTRFYLKNLAPLFRGDSAHLPFRRFLSYYLRAGLGPFEAWDSFSEARAWVETNKYRFRCDARKITELWEALEP